MIDPGTDKIFTFTTVSQGGFGAIAGLAAGYDVEWPYYPLVELSGSSYAHKNKAYRRIAYPVFTVVKNVDVAPDDAVLAASRGRGGTSAPAITADATVATKATAATAATTSATTAVGIPTATAAHVNRSTTTFRFDRLNNATGLAPAALSILRSRQWSSASRRQIPPPRLTGRSRTPRAAWPSFPCSAKKRPLDRARR